jgi:ribosomal-protein-alanine N-acetyltransferase
MTDACRARGTPAAVVPMTCAHIDRLMRYEQEMFGTEAWSSRGYRDELADTRNRCYLAIEDCDGALLAWGGVLVVADAAEILTVGVVPGARRRGLARQLVAALLAEADRRGAREAFLEVRVDNDAARQLYRTAGFVEIGRRRGYYDHGRVDAVTMRRNFTTDTKTDGVRP